VLLGFRVCFALQAKHRAKRTRRFGEERHETVSPFGRCAGSGGNCGLGHDRSLYLLKTPETACSVVAERTLGNNAIFGT
jgi:hypothetical protein